MAVHGTVIPHLKAVVPLLHQIYKPIRRFPPCRLDLVYSRPCRASAGVLATPGVLSHAMPSRPLRASAFRPPAVGRALYAKQSDSRSGVTSRFY